MNNIKKGWDLSGTFGFGREGAERLSASFGVDGRRLSGSRAGSGGGGGRSSGGGRIHFKYIVVLDDGVVIFGHWVDVLVQILCRRRWMASFTNRIEATCSASAAASSSSSSCAAFYRSNNKQFCQCQLSLNSITIVDQQSIYNNEAINALNWTTGRSSQVNKQLINSSTQLYSTWINEFNNRSIRESITKIANSIKNRWTEPTRSLIETQKCRNEANGRRLESIIDYRLSALVSRLIELFNRIEMKQK